MKILIWLIGVGLCGAAWGQSTEPSAEQLEALTRTYNEANDRLAKALEEARGRVEAREDYQTAVKEREGLKTRLEQVRHEGSAQEKLEAGAAYNEARARVEAMEAKAAEEAGAPAAEKNKAAAFARMCQVRQTLDKQAVEDFDALQKRKAEARAAALDKDPIWRGLLDKKIVIGMTLEQVRSIATPAIEHKSSEEAEREVYTWDMPAQTNLTDEQDNSSGWYMLSVVFHKGKVTSWSRHNHAAPKPVRVDVEHQAIPGQ